MKSLPGEAPETSQESLAPVEVQNATRRRRVLIFHLQALVLYTLIALLFFFPLVRNFTTHVTGNAIDDPALAWNLWWVKYSLVDLLNPDIFHVGWMFHPVQINLGFYTLTPLNGLLSIPLQSAFGLVVATNLLLLLSFVLSAYGAFLLAHRALSAPLRRAAQSDIRLPLLATTHFIALWTAGFVYAFASPKLFYAALGQYNIASSQWIPFCVLYILRIGEARTTRSAFRSGALAGLFLVLQAWSELTYASFLLIFFALAACFAIWRAFKREVAWRALITAYTTSAVIFVLGIIPFLWAMLPDLLTEGDFFSSAGTSASGGGFADLFSADLAGFLVPTRLNPWIGNWVATLPFPSEFGQQLFLGYATVALAIGGFLWLWNKARREAIFWGAASLLFWLLALGPALRWMGNDTAIPGPFTLVSLLPFFSGNRYPSRYGVMLLLCIAILAAAGVVALAEWLRRRKWATLSSSVAQSCILFLLIFVVIFEHNGRVPLTDFRIPSIYATLAAQPGDLAVFELPTGWRNGARVLGKSDEVIMMQQWYQTEHHKRRLGGNTSRNPQHKFQYFTDHPLVGDLIPLMNANEEYLSAAVNDALPAMIAHHAPIAAQELADLGVGWVTVNVEKSTPQLLEFVDSLPLTLLEEWRGSDWNGDPSTIRLYAVEPWGGEDPRTIDLADPAAVAYFAEGAAWQSDSVDRLAVRSTVELLLPLQPNAGFAIDTLGAIDAIRVNGSRPASYTTGSEPHGSLNLEQGGEPVDRVTLTFAADNPDFFNPHLGDINLSVRSAAEQVGDFAQIWLNGVNVASSERGYNLAAIDPGADLIASATFDTFASEEESARMAAWIAALPQDALVAGAVADEASLRLTQEGVDALASLGVATDLRGHFRWSHAFIGAVGAAPASAQESASVLHSVGVWQGAPQDGSAIYGALKQVTITYHVANGTEPVSKFEVGGLE